MTFTNEQLREIERVNLILLKKIMGHRKPRTKSQSQPPVNRRTSAAINRSKMEEKIERENKVSVYCAGKSFAHSVAGMTSSSFPLIFLPLIINNVENVLFVETNCLYVQHLF